MAIVLSVQDLTHRFGVRPLFEGVSFTLSDGDRVGLIGPNGAGKSTLLRILAGDLAADGGVVSRRQTLRVACLPQTPVFAEGATVREAVRAGAGANGRHDEHDWELDAKVDAILARMDLGDLAAGMDAPVSRLSGGWQKRVALARELVKDPDLLLLDEPTNHLDIESILWLEKLLAAARFATLTVTHDRLFLQRIANRILELDRRNAGGLLDVAGDYATYVERKAQTMAAQERREEVLRNTLRRETEWLRRGPPARSTKQEARIQRAGALADEVAELTTRNRTGSVALDFAAGGKSPRRLVDAQDIGKRFGDRAVFDHVNLRLVPGARVGLLGPNGCGKSTLLRVLTGLDTPTTGTVARADSLAVAWFEQDRGSLDPELSLADTVCPDGDFVDFRGSRVHRHGYLERFLFRPEQMSMAVGKLSGGEQSRILIARLMLRPANVLVLDEPTNDLDLATLGVLQDALVSFDGAVLLVTHDRYFLDQVATTIVAFHTAPEELGTVTTFASLSQWEPWHADQQARARAKTPAAKSAPTALGTDPAAKRKKLSFKDQREWETMETRIAEAESKLAALEAACADPSVASNAQRLLEIDAAMITARAAIDGLYARWAHLESLQ